MQNNSLVTMQHEMFAFASAVCGYHVYQDVWKPSIREILVAKREFDNHMDNHTESSAGQLNGRPFAS